ncbi:MAG: succinate dehydrogenase cytochrome b subunit [Crocinitomicaceae bacterium]|nr:succinate dehydrogenase cytochrome b subunit [Flavobacteriales bacterium]NQZ36586.1 succinate dehydrogenase cytochrome b subunit [Crocinitomicaceae bacterium]
MSKSGLLKSSIARKVSMALSAFFLMFFLLQHLTINMTSVFSAGVFNEISHFMGTNFVIQYLLQPVLIFGVVFHFTMGFVLELKNWRSRDVRYVKYKGGASSSWMSRNMLWTGLVILAFMGLHFYDFWIPELKIKFIEGDWTGALTEGGEPIRYFDHLTHKFVNPIRIAIYCVSFVLLSLHLLHGFNSAFQSVGANNKYTKGLQKFGIAYAILVPLGFVFIALFHHFNH